MPRLRANRERNFDAAATELRLRFGENVARVRRERGLSQEQLAEKLGCSARYVQYVEHGKANVTIDFIAAVAEVLAVAVDGLWLASEYSV